jgi:hypothetical protein
MGQQQKRNSFESYSKNTDSGTKDRWWLYQNHTLEGEIEAIPE